MAKQQISSLFPLIERHHSTHGSKPAYDYAVLRKILSDRTIITGKDLISTLLVREVDIVAQYGQCFMDTIHMIIDNLNAHNITLGKLSKIVYHSDFILQSMLKLDELSSSPTVSIIDVAGYMFHSRGLRHDDADMRGIKHIQIDDVHSICACYNAFVQKVNNLSYLRNTSWRLRVVFNTIDTIISEIEIE